MAREKRVSDDEDEDERYVVEEIVATKTNKNGTFYEVKWENYPPSANTWEPEENLMQDCPHLVRDFLKKQSKPKTTSKTPKKKRAAEAFDEEDNIDVMDLVDDESWPLERTNWQKEVDKIASCERSKDGQLVHYVRWKNGKKTLHFAEDVNVRVPQKVIKFYESHIVFTEPE